MITVIRKVEPGRWLMYPHPQQKLVQFYPDGQTALEELARLLDLWPRCASYDDFVANQPDE